eukprot:GHVL01027296.1.p1 GENE.GHVL01027296.1~~GHVL01027296.1.p1  ORF type:complete len:272 (+),score=88.15 GHVL01027296.1:605-1420(+)
MYMANETKSPISASSAFPPDLEIRPTLIRDSKLQILSNKISDINVSDLHFREGHIDDLPRLRELHSEWFPLTYNDQFFECIVGGGPVMTLLAVYREYVYNNIYKKNIENNNNIYVNNIENNENFIDYIFGLIIISAKSNHISLSDVSNILGYKIENHNEDNPQVGYILTLGVIDEYRKNGLAKILLYKGINKYVYKYIYIKCIYLHVIDYNKYAINLYKKYGFIYISYISNFYNIFEKSYGSYLYAYYLNGYKPPSKDKFQNIYNWLFRTE